MLLLLAVGACGGQPQSSTMAPTSTPNPPSASSSPEPAASPDQPRYPATRVENVKDVLHGVEVPDPFRWLEDVKSAEVQAWMTAQDELTEAVRLAMLTDALLNEARAELVAGGRFYLAVRGPAIATRIVGELAIVGRRAGIGGTLPGSGSSPGHLV